MPEELCSSFVAGNRYASRVFKYFWNHPQKFMLVPHVGSNANSPSFGKLKRESSAEVRGDVCSRYQAIWLAIDGELVLAMLQSHHLSRDRQTGLQ